MSLFGFFRGSRRTSAHDHEMPQFAALSRPLFEPVAEPITSPIPIASVPGPIVSDPTVTKNKTLLDATVQGPPDLGAHLAAPDAPDRDETQARPMLTAVIAAQGENAVGEQVANWPLPAGGSNPLDDGAFGIAVVFGEEGNAATVTVDGWSEPEADYIWTVGHRSLLVLPRPPAAGRYELRLEFAPFATEPALPAQQVGLTINDQPVAPLRLREHAIVVVDISGKVLANREQVELVFDLPDAARPVDVTGFPDDRVLGLSFRRLALLPVSSPSPG